MKSMRVTVCFGQTRVIVPCKGGATVAELVKEACARYKKAIGKSPKYWVKIRQLENAIDGGILDVDDYVYDVAEDRDQLIAVFEEEDDHTYRYNGWDHQSGSSSDGRRSPVAYQQHPALSARYSNEKSNKGNRMRGQQNGNTAVMKHNHQEPGLEVDVGLDALQSSTHITVRRGSDPMLNKEEDAKEKKGPMNKTPNQRNNSQPYYGHREPGSGQEEDNTHSTEKTSFHHHQQMMMTSFDQNISVVTTSTDTSNSVDSGRHSARNKHVVQDGKNYSNFVRDSTRQSIMGMLSDRYDEDMLEIDTKNDFKHNGMRQPPDGRKRSSSDYEDFNGTFRPGYNVERYLPPPPSDKSKFPWFYNDSQEMFVEIDERPLGLQVVSYKDHDVFCGLLVKSVDEGGRSEREGLLQQGDVIVEINNYVLAQYKLPVAQEIFKNAMKFPELQLRVYPVEERERVAKGESEEVNNALNRHRHAPSIPVLTLVDATPPKSNALSSAKSLPDLNASYSSKSGQDTESSPFTKPPLVAQMSYDTLSNNTRKIGNMFEIDLRKGDQGLGFSITTRDTPVGDPGPIYIKNILPKGAAIQDGRLQAGDRLLKVNDIEMTGHTQESAVNILRQIEVGTMVSLVISRHVSILPRKMKEDPVADRILNDDTHREYFMFEIALNDTGSAGLGISLKGNQSKKTGKDLGIFVKSVFHGGAAYQDGRLRPNDQLISVNGQKLIGMTNHEAIDTLRRSMSTVGNVRGMIQMVIARRKLTTGNPMSPNFSSEASSELSDSLINERNSRLSFEITGQDNYSAEDSFHFSEEVPRQIDPTPMDGYRDHSYEGGYSETQDDWTPSPDPNNDPFSRESIFRQSISEKRRGAATRDAQNTDTFKAIKNKQLNSENIEKKKPTPETKRSATPSSTVKWIKPMSSKTPATSTPVSAGKSPRSPGVGRRNLNNSSNFAASRTKSSEGGNEPTQEVKRSHTPLSFDYRSATPSTVSGASIPTSLSASQNSLNKPSPSRQLPPTPITETPKSSHKKGLKLTHSDNQQSQAMPIVRKSNSSESLVTFGVYSKPVPSSPTSPGLSQSPTKGTMNRGVPYLKPPVLPYADLKHLAACCAPAPSLGRDIDISPCYDRRHPLTARREPAPQEPPVEVGPTLGIAKSSSLESLQTAVENYVDSTHDKDMPFPRPKPRVLRGRVMNESFRAALDQSYDLENLSGKAMATLKEEGDAKNGPQISSLVSSSDENSSSGRHRTHEKKRAGKSYKIFGLFRVGKNKRSLSSDRNLDSGSFSSTSSSPRVPESEVHKRLLESKREDDFKKHQAETERIQAKAKAMREQQKRKEAERYRPSEDLLDGRSSERTRAPSVPVTAMQRVNYDPKSSYTVTPSGRRSVDPSAMRGEHHPHMFDWNSAKRPTSPVDYSRAQGGRYRPGDAKTGPNKIKAAPDYSSLPRQPRLEPHTPVTVPGSSTDGVVTQSNRGVDPAGRSSTSSNPTTYSVNQSRHPPSGTSSFNNYEFYNMQKPPGSGQRKAPSPKPKSRSSNQDDPSMGRHGRSGKAGRTLYYDDRDSSVSPSSTFRSKSPKPVTHRPVTPSGKVTPKTRGTVFTNGFDPSSNISFHREDSPEPPPMPHRHSQYYPPSTQQSSTMRNNRTRTKTSDKQAYRHSMHVDVPSAHDYQGFTGPHPPTTTRQASDRSSRPHERQKHALPPTFKWRTELHRKNTADNSDSDSYRTISPASSDTIERNREAYQKILKSCGKRDTGEIIVSPPCNL